LVVESTIKHAAEGACDRCVPSVVVENVLLQHEVALNIRDKHAHGKSRRYIPVINHHIPAEGDVVAVAAIARLNDDRNKIKFAVLNEERVERIKEGGTRRDGCRIKIRVIWVMHVAIDFEPRYGKVVSADSVLRLKETLQMIFNLKQRPCTTRARVGNTGACRIIRTKDHRLCTRAAGRNIGSDYFISPHISFFKQ
jgi:hypothetical protein